MRAKWRIAVINEETLGELLHVRLSLLNLVLAFIAVMLLTLTLFGVLIWYSPLKNYLPGNTQGLREELVRQNAVVDSLQEAMNYQNEYLGVIRQVVSGEVKADTLTPFDSVYITRKEELLASSMPITDAFMQEYEEKAGDNLTLFDQALQTDQLQTLLRPAQGVVSRSFSPQEPTILLQVPAHASAVAVLPGTVVQLNYSVQQAWSLVMQHDGGFLSVYSGIEKPVVQQGAALKAGEALGAVGGATLMFSLWRDGKPVDPEALIAF